MFVNGSQEFKNKDWKMMLLKDLKGSIDEIDRFEDEEKGISWFVVTNNSKTRKSVAKGDLSAAPPQAATRRVTAERVPSPNQPS